MISGNILATGIYDMKNLSLFLLRFCTGLILITSAVSCNRAKIKLEIELPENVNQIYAVAYFSASSNGGTFISSAVPVRNGKGEITLPLAQPSVIELSRGGNVIYIYAEKGDKILISGKSDNPVLWKVEGNEINNRWCDWRLKNEKLLQENNTGKINKAIARYVNANPGDPLSTLLLLYKFNRRADNILFLSLWNKLKGEAAKEKWIAVSHRSDLIDNLPAGNIKKSKKPRLIIKTLDNGVDTIVTGRVPVVLLFWRNDDSDRQLFIDSIRKLRTEHPDSSKFIIADISFDVDSMSWRSPLQRDSLRHVVRGWNPLGEADSIIRALGVERTPALIRIDP